MNRPIHSRSFDTLTNLITGLGLLGKDKNVSTQYTFTPLSRAEVEAAYRGDWVARKCIDVPAADSTREWRAWQADKKDIKNIEETEKKFDIQRKVKRALIRARLYGGGALLLGFGDDSSKPLVIEKVQAGALKYVHFFSCNELTSGEIDYDPESEFFGEPTYYMLHSLKTGAQVTIHPSRIVRFLGAELPDRSMSSHIMSGWGDSIIQVIDDAIKHVGLAAQGVAALLHEAKLDIVSMPNFSEQTSTSEYRSRLYDRFQAMNIMKSMLGVTVIDAKDKWDRKEIAFGGLPQIVELYQLLASGAVDIPATRLFGRAPTGLNATGESDLRNYYDRLKSEQATEMTPTMERLDRVIMQTTFGTQPDGVWYEWNPLWQQTPDEKATEAYKKAQVFQIDAAAGLIPEDALREGRENQLIEDGTYPGLEQALEEAELAQQQALNELDPEIRAQAEQHLLAQKAGVPLLPAPLAKAEGAGAPGEPGGGNPTGQPGNAPGGPPRGQGDAFPRSFGLSPSEARRRRLGDIQRSRAIRRTLRWYDDNLYYDPGDDDDETDEQALEGQDFNPCHEPHSGEFCAEGGGTYLGHNIEGKENRKGKVRFHVTSMTGEKLGKTKTLTAAKELVHAKIERAPASHVAAATSKAMFHGPDTPAGEIVRQFLKANPGGRFSEKSKAEFKKKMRAKYGDAVDAVDAIDVIEP